jgi:hypothetical protein
MSLTNKSTFALQPLREKRNSTIGTSDGKQATRAP